MTTDPGLASSLRQQIEKLIEHWRDAAVWEHDMGNIQSAQGFDQCADELAKLLEPSRVSSSAPENT